MNTKKLALTQLILAITILLLRIFWINVVGNISFNFMDTGIIGICFLIALIAIIVIAILQIVDHGNGVALAAGITALLSFIPFVSIAVLVLNIIVLASHK